VLYISEIRGGPEQDHSAIAKAITRIFVLKGADQPDTGFDIDVVFQVPGSVFKPEFEGVRIGSLSRKQRTLQVQIAVDAELVYGEEERVLSRCFEALHEAARLAGERLRQAKIPFNEQALRAFLERVEARAVH
jgi:hypothetical protein